MEQENSRVLWVMVWRAAFIHGTREQVADIFESCMAATHPGESTLIPHDLATFDLPLAGWLLLESGATSEAVVSFLARLADNDPADWGWRPEDYTGNLEFLMRSSSIPAIKAHAAYCLARWKGESTLGQEAQGIVKDLAKDDATVAYLQDRLQYLGTHGWEERGN